MSLVSIILPSYNHGKFIARSIESVIGQTFGDFELIVIDDASVDGSKEIIADYARKDGRIYVTFHRENAGIAKTMNEGLEIARGKFISIIASDDEWGKDKLEKQVKILMNDEDLVVWSDGLIIDHEGAETGKTFLQMYGATRRKKSGYVLEELIKGNFICGLSIIFKKEHVKDIRFDERLKYLNDYKLMTDLAYRYKFYFIPEFLVKYRVHGDNSIIVRRKECREETIALQKSFLKQYGKKITNRTKADIHFKVSILYWRLGDLNKAKNHLMQVFKFDPFGFFFRKSAARFLSLIDKLGLLSIFWKR